MVEDTPGFDSRFVDLSIDMLCVAHFDGYFKKLNPAWERTLGFTVAELQSRPILDFVHPDDRERSRLEGRRITDGAQALSFENRYLCKDGSYKWLLWNATGDLERQLIYAVARDVTASKQVEEERERLVRELQAALAEVKALQRILPICMYCKNVRDDENYWQTVEAYISQHTHTKFSHGICPACYEKLSPTWFDDPGDEPDR